MPDRFGEKLRYLRESRQINQTDFARDLGGISRFHVNNMEVGRKAPSAELAILIAEFFDVSTDYLLLDSVPVESVIQPGKPPQPDAITTYQELFRQKLQYLRQRENLSFSDLASRLGLAAASRAYLANVEAGRQLPSLSLLVRIATVFAVSTEYLLRDPSIEIEPSGSVGESPTSSS